MKTVIKEAFIMILLLIVLLLVFGIVFYDYIPTGKVIPNKIEYKIPDEIARELEEFDIEENSPTNIVYEITATDLTDYEKGKINPFAATASNNVTNNNTTNNTNSNNTSTNSNNSGSSSDVPTGNFFNTGSTK